MLLLHVSLYFVYLILLCLLIKRWRFFTNQHFSSTTLIFFFLLKVTAGIGLTTLYTYYYTDQSKADIYRYFNDSKVISQLAFSQPMVWLKTISGVGTYDEETFRYLLPTLYFSHPGSDPATNNTFIIRVISLLNFISVYNIYINTLFFSFLSFCGCYMCFSFFSRLLSEKSQILVVPFFLMPDVLFWSSGLLKEALLFFFIGLFLTQLGKHITVARVALFTIALSGIALIKIFVAIVLLIASLPIWWMEMKSRTERMIFSLVALIVVGGAVFVFAEQDYCRVLVDKRNEFVELAKTENAGSLLDASHIENCNALLWGLPSFVANAIFKPLAWESKNAMHLAFAIVNTTMLVCLLSLLTKIKRPDIKHLAAALFCFSFSLGVYLLIGITVPILGAIVHYRVLAVPFLITGFLLIVNLDFFIYIKHKLGF